MICHGSLLMIRLAIGRGKRVHRACVGREIAATPSRDSVLPREVLTAAVLPPPVRKRPIAFLQTAIPLAAKVSAEKSWT